MLYVLYTNPAAYPPIEHSALLLAEAGCDVTLLGIAMLGDAVALPAHARVTVDLQRTEQPGWRQKLHFLRFIWWVVARARRIRPDWIYASDPLSTPAALLARWMTGARLIYHEHDSPDPAVRGASIVARAVEACRRRAIRRADCCVLPNAARARLAAEVCGRRDIQTVWNLPLRREVHEPREGRRPAGLRLLYHGSIVPARLPLRVLEALATLPRDATLTIAGYDPDGGRHLSALRAKAAELGLDGRVIFAGTLRTRVDLLALAATCDVGLALMPTSSSDLNERTMLGASNKAFDYLACGLALVVSNADDWRATYADAGYGRTCIPESTESLADAFAWCYEHPEDVRIMGERGRRRILADWNYDAAFAPVLERLVGAQAPARLGTVAVDAAARG